MINRIELQEPLIPMDSEDPITPHPDATLWQRRWLTLSLSALLTMMALLTAVTLYILNEQTGKTNLPDPRSDFLTIYQASNELGKLNDIARDVLAGSATDLALLARIESLASLLRAGWTSPTAEVALANESLDNRQLMREVSDTVKWWAAAATNHTSVALTAQSVRDRSGAMRAQLDRLAVATHIADFNARDAKRRKLYSVFHQLQWTLGGLIIGSLILSVWLLRLNRLTTRLNQHLSEANVRLEAAVVRRTRQLAWLASTDSLTGLKNRRAFIENGEMLLLQHRRYAHDLTAMVLDIDHFKQINDKYGHHVGDQAIKRVTDAITMTLRESDIIGRMGGEEFAVLMPQTPMPVALAAAERVRRAVAAMKIGLIDGGPLTMTVSIGVAQGDADNSLDTLLMHADTALYQSKSNGRNRVEMFGALNKLRA
jgi:diguanylate cyclase (GGDEF)-like protein